MTLIVRHIFQFVIVSLSLTGLSVYAGNNDLSSIGKRDAQIWLRKVRLAAQNLNYSGTFMYQQANQVRASRITHVIDGKNEIEKLEILDGKPREYIRNNDEISSYMPEIRTVRVEKRATPDFFPAMLTANSADLIEHYDVKKGEGGRVAGYDCQIVTLEPKDNLRYQYRLWVEKMSGLLLRVQTMNENNEVLEQITFAQVVIGGIDKNAVKTSFMDVANWRVENAIMTQVTLPGWSVAGMPPGFKKIHELRQFVLDVPKHLSVAGVPSKHEVSQMVFSDGLAAISVFIEPGSQSRTDGYMQQGAMNIAGRRQGDFWLTIVGEVPTAAIRQVANSIEFKPQ